MVKYLIEENNLTKRLPQKPLLNFRRGRPSYFTFTWLMPPDSQSILSLSRHFAQQLHNQVFVAGQIPEPFKSFTCIGLPVLSAELLHAPAPEEVHP